MTINDPKIYTAPWTSDLKKFRRLEKDTIKTVEGWTGRCRMSAHPRMK